MSKILPVYVCGAHIKVHGLVIGASGSHDDVVMEFNFDEAWEGTTKRVVWTDAHGVQCAIQIITPLMAVQDSDYIYRVPVPNPVKAYPGVVYCTIRGVIIDEEQGTERVAITTEATDYVVLEAMWGVAPVTDLPASLSDVLQQQINGLKEYEHTHDNKALLDEYDQTNDDITDAVIKRHRHSNKEALDTIPLGGVVTKLTGGDNTIPTSKAVSEAMGEAGFGDMSKATYDQHNKALDVYDYADDAAKNAKDYAKSIAPKYSVDEDNTLVFEVGDTE